MYELTIAIPFLNEEKHLPQLIESLNKQSRKDFIVFFFDAGSTDSSKSLIKKHAKFKYKLYTNKKKLHVYAFNKALHYASTPYFMQFTAHAYLPQNYIKDALIYLTSHPSVDGVGGKITHNPTNYTARLVQLTFTSILSGSYVHSNQQIRPQRKKTILYGIYKTEVIKKYKYDTTFHTGQDLEINLRMGKDNKQLISLPLSIFYFPRSNLKRSFNQTFRYAAARAHLIKKGHIHLSWFIPTLFIIYLLTLPFTTPLFLYVYFLLILLETIRNITTHGLFSLLLFISIPIFHCTIGLGFLFGFFKDY